MGGWKLWFSEIMVRYRTSYPDSRTCLPHARHLAVWREYQTLGRIVLPSPPSCPVLWCNQPCPQTWTNKLIPYCSCVVQYTKNHGILNSTLNIRYIRNSVLAEFLRKSTIDYWLFFPTPALNFIKFLDLNLDLTPNQAIVHYSCNWVKDDIP